MSVDRSSDISVSSPATPRSTSESGQASSDSNGKKEETSDKTKRLPANDPEEEGGEGEEYMIYYLLGGVYQRPVGVISGKTLASR